MAVKKSKKLEQIFAQTYSPFAAAMIKPIKCVQ